MTRRGNIGSFSIDCTCYVGRTIQVVFGVAKCHKIRLSLALVDFTNKESISSLAILPTSTDMAHNLKRGLHFTNDETRFSKIILSRNFAPLGCHPVYQARIMYGVD
jgi:hypothetical protein